MVRDNPARGAPGIHSEPFQLGFDVSERTVPGYEARRLPRRGEAAKNWLAFSGNHREAIAALDFFTVPTAKFSREVLDFLSASGVKTVRTSVRSPRQNDVAERCVRSAPGLLRSTALSRHGRLKHLKPFILWRDCS
jgi:hypothetical protein